LPLPAGSFQLSALSVSAFQLFSYCLHFPVINFPVQNPRSAIRIFAARRPRRLSGEHLTAIFSCIRLEDAVLPI
jgi:hypothetical protein